MKKNLKPINSIIHFGGYMASGGSALRDLFYEYDDLFVFPAEFRLLKEKNGLLDLERALFISKSPDNIDLAIRDFKTLSKNLARVTTKFTRFGFNYDKFTDKNFSKYVNNFIDEITDYKYPLNTHNYDFRKSNFKSQLDRYASKFLPYSLFEEEAFMSYPQFESYIESAKKLLMLTFESALRKAESNSKSVAVQNMINHFSLDEIFSSKKYFDNLKIIIIDRDPRDIFLDFPHHRYIPKNVSNLEKAKYFIHFFKSLRYQSREIKKLDFCFSTYFEQLVNNYEITTKKIEKFTGISQRNSNLYKKKFSPINSKKNIGKYKNVDGSFNSAIKLIEDELSDFIYTF